MIEAEEVRDEKKIGNNQKQKTQFTLVVTKLASGFFAIDDLGRQHGTANLGRLAAILRDDMKAHNCCIEPGTEFHISIEKRL